MRRSKRRVVVRATVVPTLMDGICENLEEGWETGWYELGPTLWQEANFVLGNMNKITRYIIVYAAEVAKLFTLSMLFILIYE